MTSAVFSVACGGFFAMVFQFLVIAEKGMHRDNTL